mmetsp:Transcript_17452/g.19709  ORF Transcript_17452/g.19709 Transcript_17452/m.19709 type:complete len:617 (+) Transcript_17452:377-2227(+)
MEPAKTEDKPLVEEDLGNVEPDVKRQKAENSETVSQKKQSEDGAKNHGISMRLCLYNLPPYVSFKDIEKLLESFEPEICLDQYCLDKRKNIFFLKFASEGDKSRFCEGVTPETQIRNRKVKFRPVTHKEYTRFVRKNEVGYKTRLSEVGKNQATKEVATKATEEEIAEEMKTPLKLKVTPFCELPYEEQTEKKKEYLFDLIRLLNTKMIKRSKDTRTQAPSWVVDQDQKEVLCCKFDQFVSGPTENYRNKAEFSIGYSYHTKKVTVGFNHGNCGKGYMYVEDPSEIRIMSHEALKAAKDLQTLLEKYEQYKPFDRFNHGGVWRNLTIRQSAKTHEMLVNVHLNPQELTADDYEKFKQDLKLTFKEGQDYNDGYKIVSLSIFENSDTSDAISEKSTLVLLFGQEYLTEELLGKNFHVSANAFFQVNTPVCESLFKLVNKWCFSGGATSDQQNQANTTLLDICCGTGTIGICCSDGIKKIIGVDIVESAIENAKQNAIANGITNAEYHCGRAEKVLPDLLKELKKSSTDYEFVGVVDPPRSGLAGDVLKALRTCKGLDRLIYVSCNAKTMVENVVHLCMPETKNVRGPPFTPIRFAAVDLFPHTEHVECVMFLERLYE